MRSYVPICSTKMHSTQCSKLGLLFLSSLYIDDDLTLMLIFTMHDFSLFRLLCVSVHWFVFFCFVIFSGFRLFLDTFFDGALLSLIYVQRMLKCMPNIGLCRIIGNLDRHRLLVYPLLFVAAACLCIFETFHIVNQKPMLRKIVVMSVCLLFLYIGYKYFENLH